MELRAFLAAIVLVLPSVAWGACADPATPPADAAAVGFTCRTFYDNFASSATIDTTNSKVPGFKWYLGQNWPRAGNNNGGLGWPGATITLTPLAWFSTGGSGLTMSPTVDDTGLGQTMLSTCAPTANPPYWTGTAFTGGFFLRTAQSVTGSVNSNAWPLVWTWPIEFLTLTTTGSVFFVEDDHFERPGQGAIGSGVYRFMHYWQTVNGANPINHSFQSSQNPATAGSTTDSLLVPAERNGGVAKFDWFLNGTVEHVPATGASWSNGTGHADAWDVFVANHSCLILGTGWGTTMVVTSLEVWQAPPPAPGRARVFM